MAVTSGLTPTGFDKLLSTLDQDRDAAGDAYEAIRRRLVRFFDGRGCRFPEDYADETLNRVAKKLDAGESIRDVPTYAVGIARLVVMEAAKEAQRQHAIADQLVKDPPSRGTADDAVHFDCMDRCLSRLAAAERELILQYYHGEKRRRIDFRRGLSAQLNLPINALRIRAFRIRQQLEQCVTQCVHAGAR